MDAFTVIFFFVRAGSKGMYVRFLLFLGVTLRNVPEGRRSYLQCGESLKSCVIQILILFCGTVGSSEYSIV